MEYTHNWNQEFKNNTHGINNLSLCLEIGCFEGLTSNYIIDNILNENGKLICVDPLTDNYLNTELNDTDVVNNDTIYKYFNNQYDRFINNTNHYIKNNKLNLVGLKFKDIQTEDIDKYINFTKTKINFEDINIYIKPHKLDSQYLNSMITNLNYNNNLKNYYIIIDNKSIISIIFLYSVSCFLIICESFGKIFYIF